MSPSQLIEWLNNPGMLDKDSLAQLRLLLDAYPCFAPARMLYLKNLALQKDLRYSSELIRTAISVPDRRRLFQFMEDRPAESNEAVESTSGISAQDSFSIIDHFLHTAAPASAEETPDALVTNFIMAPLPSDETDLSEEKATKTANPESSEQPASTQPPSEQSAVNSTHEKNGNKRQAEQASDDLKDYELGGFTLDFLSFQALHSKSQQQQEPKDISDANEPAALLHGQELIDAFLSEEEKPAKARPLPTQSEVEPEKAETTAEDNPEAPEAEDQPIQEASFSETLARIYIKQKRYDRALEIIKTLSLKYPEKNVYFADQIRYLEKLIIHTKNN
ncbi:MAG: hypothetical protein Q8914_08300 [Bacteroidota bacterium]|nr:hypothetical protein [Bacteroidota bacterium]